MRAITMIIMYSKNIKGYIFANTLKTKMFKMKPITMQILLLITPLESLPF
jgi:hypothetical protein